MSKFVSTPAERELGFAKHNICNISVHGNFVKKVYRKIGAENSSPHLSFSEIFIEQFFIFHNWKLNPPTGTIEVKFSRNQTFDVFDSEWVGFIELEII